MWNLKQSSFIFLPTLCLGIILMISAHDWMLVWIGMEINMYSFIPLMLISSSSKSQEAATKYFLTQAFGSGVLLLGLFASTLSSSFSLLIIAALLLKAGIAPLHFWYPNVMNALPWWPCLLLTTLQKIGPLFLLIQVPMSNSLLITTISGISGITGALGGLNQTQLRAILAYSSIGHMGWILAASQFNISVAKLYFLLYMFTITSIMIIMISSQISYNAQPMTQTNQHIFLKPIMLILLLSLGGMPPLFGFFPKLMVISTLCSNSHFKLASILIISSMINMFYYLKIMYSSLFLSISKPKLSTPWMTPIFINISLMSMAFLSSIFGVMSLPLFILL